MSNVTRLIQETMQKGGQVVSDPKLGKEGYARLCDIYQDGFERIGKFIEQSGVSPLLSASWVKAGSEIAKLREESPSDVKSVLRRYESFFKEAQQLAGGMIGGSIGEGIRAAAESVQPVEKSSLLERLNFQTEDTPLGIRVRFTQPAGVNLREIAMNIKREHPHAPGIDERLKNEPGMDIIHDHDFTHDIILFVKGSNFMSPKEQKNFLKEKGMKFAHRASLVIGIALARLDQIDAWKGRKGPKLSFDSYRSLRDKDGEFRRIMVRDDYGTLIVLRENSFWSPVKILGAKLLLNPKACASRHPYVYAAGSPDS